MTEVQERNLLVSGGFDAAVSAVTPEGWDAPSPCAGWSARDVVGHVVTGHRRVVANITGEEPRAFGVDEDPKQAWRQASRAMHEVTEDQKALDHEIDGPTGKMPVGQIIGQFVTMDVLVHTWDLARTAGADEHLDEDAVSQAFEAIKPMDAMIRRPGVFGEKLEPPAGADLQTEFLCFLGRRA
jgi:uncharacterized protein (TIGR03086 family)